MHDLSTTLVAVATPAGRGGLGCVRLSGPDAKTIAASVFQTRTGRTGMSAGRPRFGRFLDRAGQAIDHGYALWFDPPRAYTGETTVELWTHGSPPILDELVAVALANGAVAAGPGEFTYRALRNGRLDLARAEAVRDLIDARTVYQARLAYAQAEGRLSSALQPLRERLEEWIARGEAAVEFVDEAETHLDVAKFREGIGEIASACRELLDGYRVGKVVREGARLAIVGAPNVGKSSLFNRLLADERAIVTEVAGTTRDVLEETVDLDGIPLTLVDTAGLRPTDDPIEEEGVRRARRAARESAHILHVLDARDSAPTELSAEDLPPTELSASVLTVYNKADLVENPGQKGEILAVSAKTGAGIDRLRGELRRRLADGEVAGDPLLTNRRHADALRRAVDALEKAVRVYDDGTTEEWVLEDLRVAIQAMAEITGTYDVEDLYDRIFSTFCIGK